MAVNDLTALQKYLSERLVFLVNAERGFNLSRLNTTRKKAKVARRRKKRNLRKNIGILSFVVIMVVIIALSALYQSEPQPTPKEPADKYFEFSEASAAAWATDETNSSIFIRQIWFDVTAVEGDATEVYIRPLQGLTDPEEFPEIIQGETELVNVMYNDAVLSDKEDNGYPVYFDVICHEAEGKVTIYVTEFYPPLSP